jgi:inward rectifier potassium channel
MRRKAASIRPARADYEIRVVGERRRPLRDFYHALLLLSWLETLAIIGVGFLVVNALFATVYLEVGGVAHARPGSFEDAFFFSVQTMGTIGYGAMYPESPIANTIMVGETFVSLTLTALMTGLIFAKFSRPTARVVFSREATIGPMNGVPTLMFRIGNERGDRIVDALIRVVLARTETLAEGGTFYRLIDLKLSRERALSLSRSWSALHVIDESSPLYGATPELARTQEWELSVLMVGLDETSMHTVHASYQYYAREIAWGARFADILSEAGEGVLVLDLSKFHETVPSTRTKDFPYP